MCSSELRQIVTGYTQIKQKQTIAKFGNREPRDSQSSYKSTSKKVFTKFTI